MENGIPRASYTRFKSSVGTAESLMLLLVLQSILCSSHLGADGRITASSVSRRGN